MPTVESEILKELRAVRGLLESMHLLSHGKEYEIDDTDNDDGYKERINNPTMSG